MDHFLLIYNLRQWVFSLAPHSQFKSPDVNNLKGLIPDTYIDRPDIWSLISIILLVEKICCKEISDLYKQFEQFREV